MDVLLEDYKQRLKNVNDLIKKTRSNGSIVHQRREERLNTKSAEYRAFIVEIERAIARQQPDTTSEHSISQGVKFSSLFDKDFVVEEEVNVKQYKCSNCGYMHVIAYDKYCSECGVKLKWHCNEHIS